MGSFSIFHIIAWGTIAVLLWRLFAGNVASGKDRYCISCGHQGPSVRVTKGSVLIELVLWICFIIPGLIYSVWRVSSRHDACMSCGSTSLVPPDSPVAVAQKKQLGTTGQH